MQDKKISIIVPIYKVENYLRTCIDSILGQTYKNLEIILVDDGSPDNCPDICEEYARADSRIKIIHKANSGLAIASGEMLFFVDSDDYINKYCLELLMEVMNDSDADIVECYSCNFADGLNLDWKVKCDFSKRKEISAQEWLTETNLGNFISCAVWNKLYKIGLYKDIKFPIGRIYEDEATTYKVISRAKKIIRIDSELYYYRLRDGSTMTGNMSIKKINDKVLAFQERADYFAHIGNVEAEKFSRAKLCLAAMAVFNDAKRLDSTGEKKHELLKIIRDNSRVIMNAKCVPIKYKWYIRFFMLKSKFDII